MPRVGGAKEFLKILKSVSASEIATEANRPLSVALVGDHDARSAAVQALTTVDSTARIESSNRLSALPELPYVAEFDDTSIGSGFPQQAGVFDFLIDVGGGRKETPDGVPIYSVAELGGWDGTLARILEDRPELALALARNFPTFRRRVAQHVIAETSTANAQFALLTGVTEAFPLTSWLLPVNSLSDIVVLTKNQMLMVLRLAAVYGLTTDYKSRLKEVAPILGNAFGWRAIARELVGAVPFVGFLVRAMIAYAGTATVGKAAQFYYETGETLSPAQARHTYREAYKSSRGKVKALAQSLRRPHRKRLAAAPAGHVDEPITGGRAPLGLDVPAPEAVPGERLDS